MRAYVVSLCASSPPDAIGYYKRDSEVRSALKAAEMGLKLRGARDVDVGMLGSLGVDQGERSDNVGCC